MKVSLFKFEVMYAYLHRCGVTKRLWQVDLATPPGRSGTNTGTVVSW